MKRFELKAKKGPVKANISRTGGLNISARIKGITLSSKHGIRMTKSAKGLTVGLQNFVPVLRGRWKSKSGLALNLSKSGFSLSKKSKIGTFNITNPNRSSINILGVQKRGKDAAGLAGLAFLLQIIWGTIKFIFRIPVLIFKFLKWWFLLIWWFVELFYSLISLIFSLIIFLIVDLPKAFKSVKEENPLVEETPRSK